MEETDFYAVLGVDRSASEDEIKKAYRKVARQLHPDVNPDDPEAERKFKAASLAYEVLKDPERRRRYDQFGIDGIRNGGGGGAGDPFGFGGNMGDVNLGDLFDAFFGGSGFGGGRRSRGGPPPGPDMETSVTIELEEAVFGTEAEVTLRLPVDCDTCKGSGAAPGTEATTCRDCQGQGEVRKVRQSILGQMVTSSVCPRCQGAGKEIGSPCQSCHGEGRRTGEKTYPVQIPAGIDRGQTLRVSGKGGAGARGGPAGDLYVHIDVRQHDRFVREGDNLLHAMHVSATQAALGAHLELATFDGAEEVHLDPGTQNGKIYRFRGKGVHHVNGRGRGDLIVSIVVDTPVKLDAEQEELLRRLAELRSEPVAEAGQGLMGKIKGAFK